MTHVTQRVTVLLSWKTRPWGRLRRSRTHHRKKLFGITEAMVQKNIYFLQKKLGSREGCRHCQCEGQPPALRVSATAASGLASDWGQGTGPLSALASPGLTGIETTALCGTGVTRLELPQGPGSSQGRPSRARPPPGPRQGHSQVRVHEAGKDSKRETAVKYVARKNTGRKKLRQQPQELKCSLCY